MTWLEQNERGRKAVAPGKAGNTHLLNKARQGECHGEYGPYAKTLMSNRPDANMVAEVEDASGGVIKTGHDLLLRDLIVTFVNREDATWR